MALEKSVILFLLSSDGTPLCEIYDIVLNLKLRVKVILDRVFPWLSVEVYHVIDMIEYVGLHSKSVVF